MTSYASAATWPPHDASGRTRQKVRRGSVPFEAGEAFFRPLAKATVVHIMRGCERLAIQTMRCRKKLRVKLRHAGELTLSDLSVLEFMLFRGMEWRTGRCAPTYQDIAEATGHARDTISAALRRLKALGILEVLRRFQVVEDPAGGGPQVHQAPNAYRFTLTRALRALLGLLDREEAMAPDVQYDTRERKRAVNQMSADASGLTGLLDTWGAALASPRVQKIG